MMVVPVIYKNILLYFSVTVMTVIFKMVGGLQIPVGRATGQRCRPFVRTKSEIERGIAH